MDLSGTFANPSCPAPTIPLSMADPGVPYLVRRLRADTAIERRLLALGLGPGRAVRVVGRAGGKLVVALGEARLALALSMAQRVLVDPAPSQPTPSQPAPSQPGPGPDVP